jgi:hypothetical protein
MTDTERIKILKAENARLKGDNELLQQRVEQWEAQAEHMTKKYLLATRPDGFNIYEGRILCDACGNVWED